MALAEGGRIREAFRQEFRPARLVPGLVAGVVLGITEVIFSLSLGSLVFSGELAPFLAFGIGIALVTSVVMLIGISLISLVPGVIGSTQDTTSVILGVIAAALVSALPAARAEEKLATILVAIAATTVLTGLFCLALGYFRLGRLVRFIPYPVMGGFLAGTGWLLLQGSFGVMADYPLTLGNLSALLRPDQLLLWAPGVLFAVVLFIGLRRIKHYLALPGILIGSVAVYYVALLITGTSIPAATARGMLLGQAVGKVAWHPFTPGDLPAVNWAAILGQGGNIAIVLILSVVSLLLNASALELATRQDIQLNRELKAAGVANLVSGLAGGMVGYHTLSLSALSYRMGARGRLPGIGAGLLCALIFVAGASLLAFFPVAILGGLLLFLGLDFLYDWVVAGWRKLSRTDYAVVLLILVVIAATNFLIDVGVGLVATILLFVLNYSRLNIVHHALSGTELRSNVERCAYHRRALSEELGRGIYILELQGFIFFGTANALLNRIRSRLAAPGSPRVRYLILDFRRVTGLDSSAIVSFVKGKQLAEAQDITLVLTHLSDELRRRFEQNGLFASEPQVRLFPDLDRGLEWCEDEVLESDQITILHVPVTLSAQLADSGFSKADTVRLREFLERVDPDEGEYLMLQGEEADKLYFIELGTVSVYLEIPGCERVRLQTLGLGTAVGEPGLYLGTKCTASVIADSPTIAYRLTRAALAEMKEKEPALAATFHEFAARLLSERLAATTRTLEAVLR
jgi:sulfate permease, SulP family